MDKTDYKEITGHPCSTITRLVKCSKARKRNGKNTIFSVFPKGEIDYFTRLAAQKKH